MARTQPEPDVLIEELCNQGCRSVNQLLDELDQGLVPSQLATLSAETRAYIQRELKDVMSVYGGVACDVRVTEEPAEPNPSIARALNL